MEGMAELLRWAKLERGAEVVVVSDSFDVAVEAVLRRRGLADLVDGVYANPARFTEEGELRIGKREGGRPCSVSGRGACKWAEIQSHLSKMTPAADFVCFAGDGANDLCASLSLSGERGDLALPRKGFALAR